MDEAYKRQVGLLLNVLPEVAKEECFALHGGTAINLFVRDMPRLSVDIDLTYKIIEDRDTSFGNILDALIKVENRISKTILNTKTNLQKNELKLQISLSGAQIKIEVNQINRGCISKPEKLILCDKAQEMFDAFCAIDIVPISQLFGGKVVAALDRQHPRDLFDVKYLLDEIGLNDRIKDGLIFSLLSSNRPIYELLNPHRTDQRPAFENQFTGMTDQAFTYDEFEVVRETMIANIRKILTDKDKQFIIGFKKLEPDWSVYNYGEFPAIRWKLENLKKFKENNAKDYKKAVDRLVKFLTGL